ncbi:sporulation protein [Desmospora activa]|uniref:Sporulation-control protein n=1 Tax=Desmospora activa DSM 45169 TaxID=1121389 RepID=A0A2T4Z3E9_9BACL|nr:sporulation protein [Desmospora activa]PTM56418.1 sporulation-control protein [Desmospora activa DSM 45169]
MSMFNKVLARFGVGNATVDTRLKQTRHRQGSLIEGEVHIQGGQVDQVVDEIYLFLVVLYHHENSQHEYVMEEFRLSEVITIGPAESKVIPFEIQLPQDTPLTTSGCPIYLKTGLDIAMAVNPDDTDGIEVIPHHNLEQVLKVIERIGFQLVSIEFEFEKYFSRHPFIQVFRFEPSGDLSSKLNMMDAVFYVGEEEMEIILLLDRRATDLLGSLEEALDLDKRSLRLQVTKEDLENDGAGVEDKLFDLIDEHSE